jgi:hypothetical protein
VPINFNSNTKYISLSQGGVTWTFTEPVAARQTVDGAWVVEGSTVSISSVTPAVSGSGASLRNGLMVDPLHEEDANHTGNGWDGRSVLFDAALEDSNFPLEISAGSVAVKCVSADIENATDEDRAGYPSETAALYVVSDLSAISAQPVFSPSPIGWTGRSGFDFWPSRHASVVASLPSYAVSTHTSRLPYSTLEPKVNRFQAMAVYHQTALADGGYQAWLTYETGREFTEGGDGASNYGQFVMAFQEQAALGMIGDEWTDSQKQIVLIGLASMGVHLLQLGAGANGAGTTFYNVFPNGLGGHCQWAQIPMECAILSSAYAPTSELYKYSPSNMLLQAFEFDASLLARLAPHTSANEPFDFRERSVIAVDTNSTPNTITVDMTLGGETFRMSTSPLKRVISTDDAASTLMADPLNTALLTESETLIPVESAAGFSGKTVYFEPTVDFVEGDYAWVTRGWRENFNTFEVDLRTTYSITNNYWGGWVMFALANGLHDAQRLPAIRWTESRAAGWREQSEPFQSQWAGQFWAQHAASIFAATIGDGGY